MAIAVVGSNTGGTIFDASTTVDYVFPGNVTSGSLIVLVGWRDPHATTDAYVAGDVTKQAGTSTIGTIALDVTLETDMGGGIGLANVGIWSCLVTGTGTLTMRLSHGAACYGGIGCIEATGSWDGTRLEDTATNGSGTNNASAPTSTDAVSAGNGLFVGGLTIPGSLSIGITEDAAFTLIKEEGDNTTHEAGSAIYRVSSGGLTDSASWAISPADNHGYAAVLAVYKEVVAGVEAALTGSASTSGIGSVPVEFGIPL